MKVLTLQITKDSFDEILSGRQKEESRNIYPTTFNRYFHPASEEDEDLKFKEYDAILLINGRKKDAPRLTVEVKGRRVVILTDEKGEDIVYEENGEEYLASRIFYKLGKIISTENVTQPI